MRPTEIVISLMREDQLSEDEVSDPSTIIVPWTKRVHRRQREVIVPEGSSQAEARPIRSDTRVKLVSAIARGRQWLSEI